MTSPEHPSYRNMYNAIVQKAPAILEKLERISPDCSKQLQELISDPLAYESEQPDSLRPSPNTNPDSGGFASESIEHLRKVNEE